MKGNFHSLLPLSFYLVKRPVKRMHDLSLSFCASKVLLKVQRKILAAVVRQLPSIFTVEDRSVVAIESTSELSVAHAIVVWLVCRPLQSLKSMLDLISQNARAILYRFRLHLLALFILLG